MGEITTDFDLDCRAPPRLAHFCDGIGTDYPNHPTWPVMQFAIKKPTLRLPAK